MSPARIAAAIFLLLVGMLGTSAYLKYRKVPYPVPKQLTPVKVRLSWEHTAEFAGMYLAKSLGYYSLEGLDVTLIPYDHKNSPEDMVLSGDSQIGLTSVSNILLYRASGKNIKAFYSLYQTSPVVLISLASDKITKPSDLNGKTITIECGANTEYQERAFFKKYNITYKEVCSTYDLTQLVSGKADVEAGFITNEPILYRLRGISINTMLLSDYGTIDYPNVFFTTDEILAQNRELIIRYVRATKKGIEYSLDHPEEAVDATLAYDAKLSREHQLETARTQSPLIFDGKTPIGMMKADVFKRVHEILIDQKLLAKPVNVEAAFTTEFIR